MKGRTRSICLAAAVLAYPAGLVPQPGGPLQVTTARFYRGAGSTQIDAFCEVPFQLLSPIRSGAQPAARYKVQVTVRDSARATLATAQWSNSIRGELLGVAGASTIEHFDFAAQRGAYTVEIAVTDSASGRVVRNEAAVVAYDRPPLASDLVVTSAMRRPAPGDTVAAAGEIRKGAFFITAATTPAITPRQPKLFYYIELYPAADLAASIVARVRTGDGRQVIAVAPQRLDVPARGGVATGGLDLTGLPPGSYQLAVDVTYADTTFTRAAQFSMTGFRAQTALPGGDAPTPFDTMSIEQLDSAYTPLVYIMEAGERDVFDDLSRQGKRSWLRQFWHRRDVASGNAPGQSQADYYGRVVEANRRFREGGAAEVPGWRTDRGRVFLRYGEPDRVLDRPHNENPYQLWYYEHGRQRVFLFMDETGLANYALWYTDEIREPSRPGWADDLPPEARRDLGRNLY